MKNVDKISILFLTLSFICLSVWIYNAISIVKTRINIQEQQIIIDKDSSEIDSLLNETRLLRDAYLKLNE